MSNYIDSWKFIIGTMKFKFLEVKRDQTNGRDL